MDSVLKLTTGFDFVRLERTLRCWLADDGYDLSKRLLWMVLLISTSKKRHNKALSIEHEADGKANPRLCQLLDRAFLSLLTQLGLHSASCQGHRRLHDECRRDLQTL